MANLLGILGGIVIFGDPLGKDPLTVTGRLGAFLLAVVAVGLVPAPTRAREAVRENEEKKLHSSADQTRVRTEGTRDEREAEPTAVGVAHPVGARHREGADPSWQVGSG
jgi:hypothetical protein